MFHACRLARAFTRMYTRSMTNNATADKMAAYIAKLTDAQLADTLRTLDESTSMSPEQHLVYAKVADALVARWGIDDEMEDVFMDEDFSGTYWEAMLIARQRVNAAK